MESPRAFIYCRISDDKTGEGLGVQRQEEDCRKLATAHGFAVAEVFVDNDVSAYNSKKARPGYSAMLDGIKRGAADRVYCWAEDRLHRRPIELEEYIALVAPRGVETHMVQGGEYELVTPEGQLRAGIMGQIARFESARKAARVQRAQEQKVRAGGWTGGTRPFGWMFEEKTPVLEPTESALIQDAFRHILTGGSLGSIVRKWNDGGIQTSAGNKWTYTPLRQVLLRPRNAGLADWKGEIVGPSEFPAIVSEDVWRAAVATLSDPTRRRSQSNKAKHLLAGIARCHCGTAVRSATIVGKDGQRHPTYRCPETGTGHIGKRIEYVDAMVSAWVVMYLSTAHASTPLADWGPELEGLELEALALRKRMNDVAIEAADGVLTMSQLRTMTERITTKLSAVEGKMVTIRQAAATAAPEPMRRMVEADKAAATVWAEATIDERRDMIRRSFDVTLLPHKVGSMRKFDPDTVAIFPRGYQPDQSQEELAAVRRSFEEGWAREG